MSGELINIVTSEVVSQVVELIKDDIYKIYLYGFYARGDYKGVANRAYYAIFHCMRSVLALDGHDFVGFS